MQEAIYIAILTAIPPTVTALAGLLISLKNHKIGTENGQNIEVVHVKINSRMDQLLKLTERAAIAVGKLEGKTEEKAAAAAAAAAPGTLEDKLTEKVVAIAGKLETEGK